MNQEERKAIELVRDEFFTNETRLYDHISATFRWLMATLFAANGGAMIALLDKGFGRPHANWAFVWFALGIISSILIGAATATVSIRALKRMIEARLKADEGLISGISPAIELQSRIERMKPNWKSWMPSYAGAASLLCFVAGLITVGLSQIG